MKLYFAGADAELDLFEELGINQILIAYPFLLKKKLEIKDNWFIDSGAFTAFNTGKEIDIDAYCDFIKKNNLKIYVGLDVIGDWKATKKNQKYMESKGLKPIPTFHYNSPFSELEEMTKKYDYIALGGLVPIKNQRNQMKYHLDRCFSITKDKIKVHGFGINNWEIMKRYPFYSVDATSWHNPIRWGQNFIFKKGKLIRTNHKKLTLDKVKNKENKLKQSILEFKKAEKHITQLWEKRGIKWE